MMTVLKIF